MTKEYVGQDIPVTNSAILEKKTSSKTATELSSRKGTAIVLRRSPRKQMKIQAMLESQKKKLLKELFDYSSLSDTSKVDMEEVKDEEQETTVNQARSVSSENVSAKKHKQEQEGNAGEKEKTSSVSLELSTTSNTSAKLDRRKYSPSKSKAKSPQNKKIKEKEILPSLKVSPKKKVGMFGKLSKKVVEDVEVKPKFQFNQLKEEQRTIKDHFSLGKDWKSRDTKPSEITKVDKDNYLRKKSVQKYKIFEEQKNTSELEFEEVSVSKTSDKENGLQRKKSVKISKIFEEDFVNKGKTDISTPKKSCKKVKKGKDGKKSIDKREVLNNLVESPAKKTIFKFSEEDKSSRNKATKDDQETVSKAKESISNVFEVEDDPYVLEKKETEKFAVRTKVQNKGRKRHYMAKMAEIGEVIVEWI